MDSGGGEVAEVTFQEAYPNKILEPCRYCSEIHTQFSCTVPRYIQKVIDNQLYITKLLEKLQRPSYGGPR